MTVPTSSKKKNSKIVDKEVRTPAVSHCGSYEYLER